MEILIIDNKYDEIIHGDSNNFEEIIDGFDLTGISSCKKANIGPGADIFVVSAIVGGVIALFNVGKGINEGIEGWVSLGKKIASLFEKKKILAIDPKGASLLAIQFIADKEEIKSIQMVDDTEINLIQLDKLFDDGRRSDELISKPYNFYIQSFLVNHRTMYIVGIKSTGEINLIKCFDTHFGYGIREQKID